MVWSRIVGIGTVSLLVGALPSSAGGGTTSAACLRSVAGASAKDVWAVGERNQGSSTRALIGHWNGTRWVVTRAPGGPLALLKGVTATAGDDAWAVGLRGRRPPHSLMLHWDGSAWRRVETPSRGGASALSGVVAFSKADAWALGAEGLGSLLLRWDGATWQRVERVFTFPPIAGSSPTDVWTRLHHWDGNAWSRVAGLEAGRIAALSVLSPTDAWAVGTRSTSSRTLTLHWDGNVWRRVKSPNPATLANELRGVSARSPSDVWAVGIQENRVAGRCGGPRPRCPIIRPLILHWNGVSWKVMRTPRLGPGDLNSVVAMPSGDAWAVGCARTPHGSAPGTFVVHWNGSAWKRVPSPSP